MAELQTTPIDCDEALRRIFEFIDHELDDGEREAMQRHLSACESCFSKADFERRLKEKLGQLREGETPGVRERIERLIKGF